MTSTSAQRPRPRITVRPWMVQAALVSAATMIVACGGGDKARAAYIARGDRVCGDARARARAIPLLPAGASAAGQGAYLRRVIPSAREEIAQLQTLTPPQDDAAAVRSYLQAQLDQVVAIEKAAAALATGGSAAAGVNLQNALGLAPRVRALAHQAGFRVCTSEFS